MATEPTPRSLVDCERIAEAKEDEHVLMIVTLRSVDGLEHQHAYPMPKDYQGCMAQWNEALVHVSQAIDNKSPLWLSEPIAVYNGAHLVSVEFSFVGASRIVERIKNAHREMGFRLDGAFVGDAA